MGQPLATNLTLTPLGISHKNWLTDDIFIVGEDDDDDERDDLTEGDEDGPAFMRCNSQGGCAGAGQFWTWNILSVSDNHRKYFSLTNNHTLSILKKGTYMVLVRVPGTLFSLFLSLSLSPLPLASCI